MKGDAFKYLKMNVLVEVQLSAPNFDISSDKVHCPILEDKYKGDTGMYYE